MLARRHTGKFTVLYGTEVFTEAQPTRNRVPKSIVKRKVHENTHNVEGTG